MKPSAATVVLRAQLSTLADSLQLDPRYQYCRVHRYHPTRWLELTCRDTDAALVAPASNFVCSYLLYSAMVMHTPLLECRHDYRRRGLG